MNYLSLVSNISDYKTYLVLNTSTGVIRIEVKAMHQPHPMVEIDDENLLKLRSFLNEIINKKESSLNENA